VAVLLSCKIFVEVVCIVPPPVNVTTPLEGIVTGVANTRLVPLFTVKLSICVSPVVGPVIVEVPPPLKTTASAAV